MKTNVKRILRLLAATALALILVYSLCACSDTGSILDFLGEVLSGMSEETGFGQDTTGSAVTGGSLTAPGTTPQGVPDERASLTRRDDVALYLHTYGHLPDNFMTKAEAREKGWSSGSLEKYAPGCCIGGDLFGNYEGLLPKASGRQYYECDIDTRGASSRGAKRIVYSNDGLIYYTDDHYESFTLLYGNG